MRIAITDACIFIDIYELHLTTEFFSLDLEIHTSFDVYAEVHEHQKELLKAFQALGKFTIHKISQEDRLEIIKSSYPKSLSDNDKTVLYLAEKLEAMVISSDKRVRHSAKNKTIEYHGMLWIFDRLIEKGAITATDATLKLRKLINSNMVYQNNAELVAEMDKRLKLWGN